MKQQRLQAFSLVELSIVILIIGVLIAVIGEGMDLLQETRVKAGRVITDGSYVNKINKLSLWLETTREESFSTTYANGDSVTKWKDTNPQSNQKINFIPAATAPTYKENGINGLPAMAFVRGDVATSNGMKTESAITNGDLIAADQVTLFVVWNNHAVVESNLIATSYVYPRFGIHAPWSDGSVYFDFGSSSGSAGRASATAPVGMSSSTINVPVILSFIKNGANVEARVNGRSPYITSSVATDTLNVTTSTTTAIFSGTTADVAELIIFAKALTAPERKAVEKYLGQKYAIKLG